MNRKFVVLYDLYSIGGGKTLHGPFDTKEEAEAWKKAEVESCEVVGEDGVFCYEADLWVLSIVGPDDPALESDEF